MMFIRTFLVILLASGLFAKPLEYEDIRKTMRELFYYHADHKELGPTIIRRSFKIYLEQFDPEMHYLLKSEVKPFFQLSNDKVAKIIHSFERDDYGSFVKLGEMISISVRRARHIRQSLEKDILEGRGAAISENSVYMDYAEDERELKKRIARDMASKLKLGQAKYPKDKLQKMLTLYEKKRQSKEKSYVFFNSGGAPLPHSAVAQSVALHTLKAMSHSLDAHSGYYSPEEAYEIRASLKKQVEGIGVMLSEGIDGVIISDLAEGGSALESGFVQKGDIIVKVNGRSTEGLSFEEVLEELKGSAGSRVKLELRRGAKTHSLELTRKIIPMSSEIVSYSSEPIGSGIIGKITLPAFYDNGSDLSAEKDLRFALKDLKDQGDLQGLVIDMRKNPGGFLSQAVKIAGMFITRGVVVLSKYSSGQVEYMRNLDGRVYFDGPLVLLTSKASASAAEIVAGALQDYGVALVVGDERTYGKGTMQYQTITDPNADSFYRVTVGRYYTVSGRSTQIEGVKADLLVPTRYAPYNIGERYLEYPLTSDAMMPAFKDPLTGLDPKAKEALQQKYLPYLQEQNPKWRMLLPTLKLNSQKRISGNRDYQYYLDVIYKKDSPSSSKRNFGASDLQMNEAVNIVRDMVQMSL